MLVSQHSFLFQFLLLFSKDDKIFSVSSLHHCRNLSILVCEWKNLFTVLSYCCQMTLWIKLLLVFTLVLSEFIYFITAFLLITTSRHKQTSPVLSHLRKASSHKDFTCERKERSYRFSRRIFFILCCDVDVKSCAFHYHFRISTKNWFNLFFSSKRFLQCGSQSGFFLF